MGKWRFNVFYFSRDHDIKVSRDFEGGVLNSLLSQQPARFGVYRPDGTGNDGVCNISSNSNSISNTNFNAKISIPRFTNGQISGSTVWNVFITCLGRGLPKYIKTQVQTNCFNLIWSFEIIKAFFIIFKGFLLKQTKTDINFLERLIYQFWFC